MPKFTVYATETVSYVFEVEAASEEEAREMVYDGEAIIGEPDDAYDFEVNAIERQPDELVTWYRDGVRQNKLKEKNNA